MDEASYVFNQESMEEQARLNNQAGVLNTLIPLPDGVRSHAAQDYQVLDLGCGPGSWAMSVARQFPKWHVHGLDLSERMINYAQVQAKADRVNATFQVGNGVKPLPFGDGSLDFVFARMIQGFVLLDGWTRLFAEIRRVLRPGGYVQLVESERPACNKAANTRLNALIAQTGVHFGVSSSPDGQLLGVCHLLPRLLKESGFAVEQELAYAVNYSAGTSVHSIWCENVLAAFKQLPGILQSINIPIEETERLCQEATQEMAEEDFCALMFFLGIVARKPIN